MTKTTVTRGGRAALLREASTSLSVSSGPQVGKKGFSGDRWQDFLALRFPTPRAGKLLEDS